MIQDGLSCHLLSDRFHAAEVHGVKVCFQSLSRSAVLLKFKLERKRCFSNPGTNTLVLCPGLLRYRLTRKDRRDTEIALSPCSAALRIVEREADEPETKMGSGAARR